MSLYHFCWHSKQTCQVGFIVPNLQISKLMSQIFCWLLKVLPLQCWKGDLNSSDIHTFGKSYLILSQIKVLLCVLITPWNLSLSAILCWNYFMCLFLPIWLEKRTSFHISAPTKDLTQSDNWMLIEWMNDWRSFNSKTLPIHDTFLRKNPSVSVQQRKAGICG